jgi:hypothetical protein
MTHVVERASGYVVEYTDVMHSQVDTRSSRISKWQLTPTGRI